MSPAPTATRPRRHFAVTHAARRDRSPEPDGGSVPWMHSCGTPPVSTDNPGGSHRSPAVQWLPSVTPRAGPRSTFTLAVHVKPAQHRRSGRSNSRALFFFSSQALPKARDVIVGGDESRFPRGPSLTLREPAGIRSEACGGFHARCYVRRCPSPATEALLLELILDFSFLLVTFRRSKQLNKRQNNENRFK